MFECMSFEPLRGIRVVDLTSSLAGPTCTEILAALGAEVIKVEHPGRGDEARAWGPPFFDGGSVLFFAANRSKRSLGARPEGAARQGGSAAAGRRRRRVRPVDARRDGRTPRPREHSLCERVTSGSSTARSGRSARRDHSPRQPGYDPLMQAFAGLISITGEAGRPGVRVGASVVDIGTGVWAALGVVAALHERSTTGVGRDVDVALLDTALSLVAYQLTATLASGVAPGRYGTAFPLIAPYEVFATADGELMVAAANDGLFRRLCEQLGLPELADDPRFATNPDRLAHREELLPPIRARLAERPSAEWLQALEGIPVAEVQDLADRRPPRAGTGSRHGRRDRRRGDRRRAAADRRRAAWPRHGAAHAGPALGRRYWPSSATPRRRSRRSSPRA